ncbi:MAG: hypothetical protein K1Y02_01525 [Candidatus Hydrogenedentes bacterium]|nr:hypothetical protein [Candidatus Hydrogenedentota bacterium]
MADKQRPFGEGEPEKDDAFGTGDSDFGALTGGEGGLGNLPPLSDFESSAGKDFDSGLPPLSGIDMDSGKRGPEGLPPISDIPVETPIPTGGNIKVAPPSFGSTPAFGTPSGSGLDTPSAGSSFQDLAADSDFTPETPEMAPPGPDSDIDTPLFDSAFGGGGTFSGAADTSAPTQAMETPMFGASPGGFDADAFTGITNGGGRGFDAGTPLPDFGPDTAAPTAVTPPPVAPKAPMAPAAKGGKGGGTGKMVMAAVIMLVVGLLAGPFIEQYVPAIPYPVKTALESTTKERDDLKAQVKKLTENKGTTDQKPLTREQIDAMIAERDKLTSEIDENTKTRDDLLAQVASKNEELTKVTEDLNKRNEEFVQAEADYEQLVNDTAITRARKEGLEAESERLESLVGKLEDANQRRLLTKDTLDSNIDQLAILVSESCPLAPEEYSRDVRIARVNALKQKSAGMKWVDPALLDEYTSLYTQELEIAKARKYFFAKIPVSDRFGTPSMMWAECLMNGNWSVYYRTLDGSHMGVYQNTERGSGPAKFAFMDVADEVAMKQIETEVFAARPEGYEEKLEQIAKKQLATDDRTELQKKYDAL